MSDEDDLFADFEASQKRIRMLEADIKRARVDAIREATRAEKAEAALAEKRGLVRDLTNALANRNADLAAARNEVARRGRCFNDPDPGGHVRLSQPPGGRESGDASPTLGDKQGVRGAAANPPGPVVAAMEFAAANSPGPCSEAHDAYLKRMGMRRSAETQECGTK